MHITYLHQYFNNIDMSGGTRSYEFARRLVAMGHTVDLLTADRESETSSGPWRVSDEDGIRVHWTPVPYANTMSYRARIRAFGSFATRAALRAAAMPTDVVFASSTPLTVALPGAFAARRRRAPMVLEVRDLWPEVPIALGALDNPLARAAAEQLARFAYTHAEEVVALSPGMRDGVLERGYPPDKVTVIPNACDIDLFEDSAKRGVAFRSDDAWIGNNPLVVYCGTVGLVNGVDYLIKVAAAMHELDPDVRFLIAGSGRCLSSVTETAATLGVLGENVRFMGDVPKRETPSVFGAATIAVSTVIDVRELHANSANKFFDALAAGTPVAVNHEGWQADLLRRSGAGLVLPATDHRAAAHALLEAVRSTEKCRAMSVAGRRLAEEQFDRDRLARELERVLLSAVDSYRARKTSRSRAS